MLQIKFGCNRPAGLGDIHVWKCGCTDGCTDTLMPARVPSYKLTLWAFGSGELINGDNHIQTFNLGRYIVSFMVKNYVLRLRWRFDHKTDNIPPLTCCCKTKYPTIKPDDIPPKIKILNTVIPLVLYKSLGSIWLITSSHMACLAWT